MKQIIFTIALLASAIAVANAQDIITKKNGDEIKAKVVEVGVDEVKYKRFGNESGPTYILPKSEIFMIKYEGGDKDVFTDTKEQKKETKTDDAPTQKATTAQQSKTQVVAKSQPAFKTQTVVKKENTGQAVSTEKVRNKFLSAGFSSHIAAGTGFAGGTFGFGYYISPKSLFGLEYSGGSHTGEELGSFTYYITKNGSTTNHSDGKITYNYSVSAFLVSWSYVVPLSEKVQWRIGPSLGVLTISGKDAYSPTYVEGTKIDGLPDPESEGRTAASLGLNTGLTWSFSERWFLDLGYRLSGNTGIDFERRYLSNLRITVPEKDFGIVGSQINLIVGWRF